jgi:hypothetical protein
MLALGGTARPCHTNTTPTTQVGGAETRQHLTTRATLAGQGALCRHVQQQSAAMAAVGMCMPCLASWLAASARDWQWPLDRPRRVPFIPAFGWSVEPLQQALHRLAGAVRLHDQVLRAWQQLGRAHEELGREREELARAREQFERERAQVSREHAEPQQPPAPAAASSSPPPGQQDASGSASSGRGRSSSRERSGSART